MTQTICYKVFNDRPFNYFKVPTSQASVDTMAVEPVTGESNEKSS